MYSVAVCLGGNLQPFETTYDYYVGVDRACLFLLENGLALDMAVGDFDSVSPEELATIRKQANAFYQAQPEKNDTDAELALKLIFERWPEAQVTIYGGFGGRLDHQLSNIFLPSDPELAPYMSQFVLRDATNLVQFFPAGCHKVCQEAGMTYIAFMPSTDGELTILDAKYPLTRSNFFQKKIYSSNEFIGQTISFSLSEGYVVVIQSRDGR